MIGDHEPPQEKKNGNPPPPLPPLSLQLKQEEKKTKAQPLSFSSLPDEIAENILARISKRNYTNLSLVSKRFLSLLSSPEIYKTRSRIGTTETCLYFCLVDLPNIPSPKWFTLWMEPAVKTLTDEDDIPDKYSLVPVPSCPHLNHVPCYSTVAVGSDIYVIGGPYEGPPSSLVRILDCRSHTWRDGPSMLVVRAGAYAYFIDGKIYVLERFRKEDSWMEVLDIKTQTWSPLVSHGATEFLNDWFMIKLCRGKIYAIAKKNYSYDPKEGTWVVLKPHKKFRYIDEARCEINNVLYSYSSSGCIKWYSSKSKNWIKVKGLDLEQLGRHRRSNLAGVCVLEVRNHGGKLLVMWVSRFQDGNPERKFWCAQIALIKKRHEREVWGKIEWANTVLTVSKSFRFLSCVVISL